MMMSVSTTRCKLLDALVGLAHALGAFELEGLGHDATVSTPSSRAACAMIGAAPVPVPAAHARV